MAQNVNIGANRYDVIGRLIDGIVSVMITALVCGTIVVIGYWVYLTLIAYAGKSTSASVAISFVTDFKLDQVFAYFVGGSGALYGYRQRRLMRGNIERLSGRPRELEKRIDPNRTSSGLTPQGTTHPGDR